MTTYHTSDTNSISTHTRPYTAHATVDQTSPTSAFLSNSTAFSYDISHRPHTSPSSLLTNEHKHLSSNHSQPSSSHTIKSKLDQIQWRLDKLKGNTSVGNHGTTLKGHKQNSKMIYTSPFSNHSSSSPLYYMATHQSPSTPQEYHMQKLPIETHLSSTIMSNNHVNLNYIKDKYITHQHNQIRTKVAHKPVLPYPSVLSDRKDDVIVNLLHRIERMENSTNHNYQSMQIDSEHDQQEAEKPKEQEEKELNHTSTEEISNANTNNTHYIPYSHHHNLSTASIYPPIIHLSTSPPPPEPMSPPITDKLSYTRRLEEQQRKETEETIRKNNILRWIHTQEQILTVEKEKLLRERERRAEEKRVEADVESELLMKIEREQWERKKLIEKFNHEEIEWMKNKEIIWERELTFDNNNNHNNNSNSKNNDNSNKNDTVEYISESLINWRENRIKKKQEENSQLIIKIKQNTSQAIEHEINNRKQLEALRENKNRIENHVSAVREMEQVKRIGEWEKERLKLVQRECELVEEERKRVEKEWKEREERINNNENNNNNNNNKNDYKSDNSNNNTENEIFSINKLELSTQIHEQEKERISKELLLIKEKEILKLKEELQAKEKLKLERDKIIMEGEKYRIKQEELNSNNSNNSNAKELNANIDILLTEQREIQNKVEAEAEEKNRIIEYEKQIQIENEMKVIENNLTLERKELKYDYEKQKENIINNNNRRETVDYNLQSTAKRSFYSLLPKASVSNVISNISNNIENKNESEEENSESREEEGEEEEEEDKEESLDMSEVENYSLGSNSSFHESSILASQSRLDQE